MARKPLNQKQKARLSKEQARQSMSDYRQSHDRCAVCHWSKFRYGRLMEIHHINGRRGSNPHDPRNLILLCATCHHAVHNRVPPPWNTLVPGCILTAKEEEDGFVDLKFIAGLKRRLWLGYDPAPIPEPYLEERLSNGRA